MDSLRKRSHATPADRLLYRLVGFKQRTHSASSARKGHVDGHVHFLVKEVTSPVLGRQNTFSVLFSLLSHG